MLRYLSLFSGIGGFDLGFDRAGMQCAGQVEYDAAARSVLARHWHDVPRVNDVREVKGDEFGTIDIVCGGFPCQDVSVAGHRAGLAGERSGLWYEFRRIIDAVKPGTVVIENVPGLLSSCGCSACVAVRRILRIHRYIRRKRKIDKPCPVCLAGERMLKSHRGRDFAIILQGLVELGYGVAWRILDAQYFGVPQRRRRVFIVGSLGDGSAAEILFECESGSGDIAPGGKARAFIAGTIAPGAHPGGFNGNDADRGMLVTHSLTANGHDASEDGTGRGTPIVAAPRVARQAKGGFTDPVSDNIICTTFNGYTGGADDNDAQGGHLVFDWQSGGDVRHNVSGRHTSALQASQTPAVMALHYSHDFNQDRIYDPAGIAPAHNASDSNRARNMATSTGVRRLTPTECERLQGFPDGWTAGQSDSARYRQLGNAVAVPVVKWLGDCIADAGIDRRARAAVED